MRWSGLIIGGLCGLLGCTRSANERDPHGSVVCAIDSIGGKSGGALKSLRLVADGNWIIDGWISESNGRSIRHFQILLKGSNLAEQPVAGGVVTEYRPDVAAALHASGMQKYGFSENMDLHEAVGNSYQLIFQTSVGQCDPHINIVISDPAKDLP